RSPVLADEGGVLRLDRRAAGSLPALGVQGRVVGPDPRRVLEDDPAVEPATEVDRKQQDQQDDGKDERELHQALAALPGTKARATAQRREAVHRRSPGDECKWIAGRMLGGPFRSPYGWYERTTPLRIAPHRARWIRCDAAPMRGGPIRPSAQG